MPEASNDIIVTSVFMALEGAFAYSAFLPSIMTIGTFVDSEEKVTMIREGEIVGTAFLIGLSVTVSLVVKSPLPLFFGLIAGALALTVYEYALRDSPAWTHAGD
jgi:Sec-independent protein secretion pathway component TatC